MSVRIAASILSAHFEILGEEIAATERGGADLIHVDVMDGHFVPNISIGQPVNQAAGRVAKVPLDVHLMIEDPDRFIPEFAAVGRVEMISVHVEAVVHLHRTLQLIKSKQKKAGVALNPATPVWSLERVAQLVDFVVVMSVNPGFGGQMLIEGSAQKVADVRAYLDRAGNPAPVEIDGGVDRDNVADLVRAGARIVVAGSSIYRAAHIDAEGATRELKTLALEAASLPAAR